MLLSDTSFYQDLVEPSNRLRFLTESMPDFVHDRRRSRPRFVNLKQDIKNDPHGTMVRVKKPFLKHGKKKNYLWKPYPLIDEFMIRDHVSRSVEHRGGIKHFLTTYDDDQPVSWFYLDFDIHASDYDTVEYFSQKEKLFDNVDKMTALSYEHGFDALYTSSPGRLRRFWIKGVEEGIHVQGLHCWLRLSSPLNPAELRPMLNSFVEKHGFDCEHSCTGKHRPIRLGGQLWGDMCEPDPMKMELCPVLLPQIATKRRLNNRNAFNRFALVVNTWDKLEPFDVSLLNPERNEEIRSKPKIRINSASIQISDDVDDGNTFDALWDSKLMTKCLMQFSWNPDVVDDAVDWLAPQFKRMILSKRHSETCSHPAKLDELLRKCYLHGCDSVEATEKSTGFALDDILRIRRTLSVDIQRFPAFAQKKYRMSINDVGKARRFFTLIQEWNGRVFHKNAWECFGRRTQFTRFMKTFPIFIEADPYSMGQSDGEFVRSGNKCRQYAISPALLDEYDQKERQSNTPRSERAVWD